MAKGNLRVMDSDIHVVEPHDLWLKYIDPRFRDRAPRFEPIAGSEMEGWQFEGKVFPAFFDRPERRRLGAIRRQKARARHVATGRYRDPKEDLKGNDPRSMVQAMDREGIDVAIVFRTMGSHVIAVDGLDPELSAAVCRGFNTWLADFCDTDRARLKPAAVMPMHDVRARGEVRRRRARSALAAPERILPAAVLGVGGSRRGGHSPCHPRHGRRQHRHLERLASRRLRLSQRDRHLSPAAGRE